MHTAENEEIVIWSVIPLTIYKSLFARANPRISATYPIGRTEMQVSFERHLAT
jgi:hypothetical protein